MRGTILVSVLVKAFFHDFRYPFSVALEDVLIRSRRRIRRVRAWSALSMTPWFGTVPQVRRLQCPGCPRLASCSPPSRTLRAACGGGLGRPEAIPRVKPEGRLLTAAARDAWKRSGRDEKTALQPNQKTTVPDADWRTTRVSLKADVFAPLRRFSPDPLYATTAIRSSVHLRSSRISALAMMTIFRMIATMATFASFPARRSASYFSLS